MTQPDFLVLCGPAGSGKTTTGIRLAETGWHHEQYDNLFTGMTSEDATRFLTQRIEARLQTRHGTRSWTLSENERASLEVTTELYRPLAVVMVTMVRKGIRTVFDTHAERKALRMSLFNLLQQEAARQGMGRLTIQLGWMNTPLEECARRVLRRMEERLTPAQCASYLDNQYSPPQDAEGYAGLTMLDYPASRSALKFLRQKGFSVDNRPEDIQRRDEILKTISAPGLF